MVSSIAYAFPRGDGWSTSAEITSADRGIIIFEGVGPLSYTLIPPKRHMDHKTFSGSALYHILLSPQKGIWTIIFFQGWPFTIYSSYPRKAHGPQKNFRVGPLPFTLITPERHMDHKSFSGLALHHILFLPQKGTWTTKHFQGRPFTIYSYYTRKAYGP